ncbi:DNA adenine methylase [Flavobacterium sp. Fl-318]|uniref:site-specific DNA-methyltransferase (adenine-specific) n=1 Tax=Flavobacterium cupriresistens TaxID=2893885 RepID=A0ABU4R5Y0_9FLAO|nr:MULTISPECIES: DNA adenine methylase [unclassified Flavobacterium]MDX6188000.1 DNA adenine methylase [Flavobacterium sp. Fl-318]UFH42080.1 DNA adenine methylase [Flavobacterium sp. F-323]
MEKKKIFKSAPLPFMGQKRKFLSRFKSALQNYSPTATYVDLFGGSGLLSHAVKSVYPNAKVIFNDYDNYRERLSNVDKTNQLVTELRYLLKDYSKDSKIIGDTRKNVLDCIKQAEKKGYVDYITLSSNLIFSMNYVKTFECLEKETIYNRIRQSNYDTTGYLDGIEVTSQCYKTLFVTHKDKPEVIFLVDPPYLSTDTGTYKSFWKLRDYLDVLNLLDNTKYFYFTSNKSSIIELCEWIETKTPMSNPFAGAYTETMNTAVTFQSSYTDIMIYKT